VEADGRSVERDIKIVLSHPMIVIAAFLEGIQESMNVIHAEKIFELFFS